MRPSSRADFKNIFQNQAAEWCFALIQWINSKKEVGSLNA